MSDQPIVSVQRRPECLVAKVNVASLDERSTRSIEEDVRAQAAESRDIALVLDMSEVEYLPSVSLGALVTISVDCKKNGQRFMLACLQQRIREALALTRLDKLFEIVDTVDAAAAAARHSRT